MTSERTSEVIVMIAALREAARRPRGNVCPIHGIHGAAQTAMLAAMARRGLIDWEGAIPYINDAGRAAVEVAS